MLSFEEYAARDGLALGAMVNKGEVAPSELLEAAIARAAAVNPKINAIVYEFHDLAREMARARGSGNAPFEGVPFLLKDILGDLAGVSTRFGSRYAPAVPATADAELVARFKRAGFVPFGKTNVPEFGLPPITQPVLYGPARNPWNLDLITGGSSGGEAAAVAAGIVPVAHANDAGGSIRIPAACCGLVGLKPTRGRNSLAPRMGEAFGGLLAEHVVTRTVRDSAATLDATHGPMPGDPYFAPPPHRTFLEEVSRRPRGLKIAFSTRTPAGAPVHPVCAQAVTEAAKLCEELGHRVEEASPINDPTLIFSFMTVYASGLSASIEAIRLTTGREPSPDTLEAMTWNLYQTGKFVTAAQYLIAITLLQRASRSFAEFFEPYDLWLTPTLGSPPLRVGEVDLTHPAASLGDERIVNFTHYNPLYNISGLPAVSLPLHRDERGVPIGVSFGAKYGEEGLLFSIAAQLEEARPWSAHFPALWRATARPPAGGEKP